MINFRLPLLLACSLALAACGLKAPLQLPRGSAAPAGLPEGNAATSDPLCAGGGTNASVKGVCQ